MKEMMTINGYGDGEDRGLAMVMEKREAESEICKKI